MVNDCYMCGQNIRAQGFNTKPTHTPPKITCYTVVLLLRRTLIVFIVRAIGITTYNYIEGRGM